MKSKDALRILNLRSDVSLEDAKKAYRTLAKKHHPDMVGKNPTIQKDSEARMKEINLAFRILAPQLNTNKKLRKNTTSSETGLKPKSETKKESAKKMNSEPAEKPKGFSWEKIIKQWRKIFDQITDSEPFTSKNKAFNPNNRKTASKTSMSFDEIFKKVHPVRTEERRKTTDKNPQIKSNPYSRYQNFMALKKKIKAMQPSRSKDMNVGKIQKISPIKPVTRIK